MIIFTPNTVIKSADINLNFSELKIKTDYVGVPDNSWIEVGSGGSAPAFQNSWINYDNTWESCAFRKDTSGYVHLKGLVKSGTIGTATAIFILPVGYRPRTGRAMIFCCQTNQTIGRINIRNATGNEGYVCCEVGNNAWVSLDGISFKAEV